MRVNLVQFKNFVKGSDDLFAPIVAFFSCFVLTFVMGSFVIRPQTTKAVTGLSLVSAPTMTLTTDTSSIELNPKPGVNDGLASDMHSLTATTNVPTGYSLALSTIDTLALSKSAGTHAAPSALADNTWGYAVAGAGGFDATYTAPTPSATSKWADPTAVTIKTTNSATASDVTSVHYGAKVDMSLASGTYTSSVRYTATANISNIPTPTIISVTPNSGTTAGGTAIQIVGTGFAVNDQSATTAVTVGELACENVNISSNTPATGQDTIYCNTPVHAAGAVNVAVTTFSDTATSADAYTYIVPANVTFVSPSVASTIAGTESGPAFTIVGTGFTGATSVTIGGIACASFEIISDTHIFCKAPNTINTTGNKTVVVTKSSVLGTSSANVAYNNTAYPTFQSSSAYANCTTTAQLYRDARDSQLYYVKKMPDNKCWMVDNLKYANYGDLSQENGESLTSGVGGSQSATNYDIAKYVDPNASRYCLGNSPLADMPATTNTRCGLFYNWYAATNGTGTFAQSTEGTNVTGSICPANFRLPSAMSDGITATGNGTSYDAADFPVLNASMYAGTPTTGDVSTTYYEGWQPSGVWSGTISGRWLYNFTAMETYGNFWSSTARTDRIAYRLSFSTSSVSPGTEPFGNKFFGQAVRCVMEDPTPVPPVGSNPNNISSTNPAVLDVYPTTGWEGDTVAITSDALFTNVSAVTIGGAACQAYNVISSSVIACRLPAKIAGTTNDIVVTNDGINITNSTTYKHMKITYFNPSTTIVSIAGTTYNFYPNGFTNVDCSTMTSNNAAIMATPAASIAYVRDTRNNQTYKVKKMADNKCWMIDNLKYISIDMTFNNGDHSNNGGTTAFNTIDESNTQSDTNSDKAFYNNPMSDNYCYNTLSATITNTMTHCGYLYNWYAATNGTGTYAQNTRGNQVTGNICPANFRLPSSISNGTTPTSNGTSFNAADFAVLNASMNAGSLTTGNVDNNPTGWRSTGAWGGALSGSWVNSLGMSSYGFFWTSTVNSATSAHHLNLGINGVNPYNYTDKYSGFTVRCVSS